MVFRDFSATFELQPPRSPVTFLLRGRDSLFAWEEYRIRGGSSCTLQKGDFLSETNSHLSLKTGPSQLFPLQAAEKCLVLTFCDEKECDSLRF